MKNKKAPKWYIIFILTLFLILSVYPIYVLFINPVATCLKAFVPINAWHVIITFAILFYAQKCYRGIMMRNKQHHDNDMIEADVTKATSEHDLVDVERLL